jgi:VanZ family protein
VSAAPAPRPASWKRDRFYRRTLPAYWLFLACATHFPKARIDLGIESSDKLAHFLAYGVLSFLFWQFAETFTRPLSGRFVWVAFGVLAAYAALDELTQPLFNRGCEWLDWICDVAAVAIVLAALEIRRRLRRPLAKNKASA